LRTSYAYAEKGYKTLRALHRRSKPSGGSMSLLVKASREGQTIARVTPETAMHGNTLGSPLIGWKPATRSCMCMKRTREVCIVVLSGTVSIEAGDHKWEKLGSRDSVFEDTAPYAVYLPPGLAATIRAIVMPKSAWRARPPRASFRRG
jgi:5-deoxy-D-glucuronate isomerase